MGTFLHAKWQHRTVAKAALENPKLAADLWNGILGIGTVPIAGSFAEAVLDTVPLEHAALLATDDVAVAFAFDVMWDQARSLPISATPFDLRTLAREQWLAFSEQAEKTEKLSSGFGWGLGAAWAHASDVRLAQGDMSQVERLARLAGRMYLALRGAQASKVQGVPSEVYSVEQGNDLGRLLPVEQVLLMDPLLETVALERIVSRRAVQYAVRGTTKVSKGPLVLALDESGSMRGPRNEWAKAAAVALARVAADEKRPVCVVHYSTSTMIQPLPSRDTAAVLKMIQHFLGKGTAIGLALGVAVQQVRDLAQKGHKGADIILVTDGDDDDETSQAAALQEAQAIGARLWTVAIECAIDARSPLRAKAAHYIRLGTSDLADGKSVSTLVGAA
jgi:Mg-chelatase subunit ChlD